MSRNSTGSDGSTSATNFSSTADSVPKEETTASRPGSAPTAASTISRGLACARRVASAAAVGRDAPAAGDRRADDGLASKCMCPRGDQVTEDSIQSTDSRPMEVEYSLRYAAQSSATVRQSVARAAPSFRRNKKLTHRAGVLLVTGGQAPIAFGHAIQACSHPSPHASSLLALQGPTP